MKYSWCLLASLCLFSMAVIAQYKSEDVYSNFAVRSQSDPVVMEELIKQNETHGHNADTGIAVCALAYAERGDTANVQRMLGQVKQEENRLYAWGMATLGYIRSGHYSEAAALCVPYIQNPVANSVLRAYRFEDYATVLYHKLDYKNALYYLQEARVAEGFDFFFFPRYGELYSLLLMHTGQTKEAAGHMRVLLMNGTERGLDFRVGARKLLPDYNEIVASSKKHFRDSTIAKIRKEMGAKNTMLPEVAVKDKDGKDFYLKSLQGKTVFIYFWTVGEINYYDNNPLLVLQRAKAFYAKDTNVVFIGIHTNEKTATAAEEAKAFMAKSKCDLDLYMDLRDGNTGKSPIGSTLDMEHGSKFVILDKKGVAKVIKVGVVFRDKAFEEVKAMVDAVKGANL